ncbi:telomerase RNA component interacting RNase-like [Brienomyrus brachyistius]|uniref:telomerase RNA component interacting RNase-like n=1 Tax=Brienomyrus brachyistius TaxID=42636 RepID=UPI0020B41814|nr:telomerase RNA component interacting RNase-like [Brienomyrus brachyistius]
MDSKRSNTKTSQSSSSCDSSGSSPGGSPSSPAPCKAPGGNAFANDGSFMEMFKKKMEEEKRKRELEQELSEKRSAEEGQSTQEKKTFNATSFVGKRRGGAKLALKTGMVAKKQKLEPEVVAGKGDAWTKYMAEVKKYKAHQCGDDDKTRPLVK